MGLRFGAGPATLGAAGAAGLGQLGLDPGQARAGLALQAVRFGAEAVHAGHPLFPHPDVGLPEPLRQDERHHQEQAEHHQGGPIDIQQLRLRGLGSDLGER